MLWVFIRMIGEWEISLLIAEVSTIVPTVLQSDVNVSRLWNGIWQVA